jgi:chloramphenicol-sensitive protein RarD
MSGLQSGVIAFFIWGFAPMFWQQLQSHNAYALVAHRVVWSLPLLVGVLACQGRTREWLAGLRQPRLYLTTLLLAINWVTFIYLTLHRQFVQCSLGYFLVPLLTVACGVVFLREHLRRMQVLALTLAGLALLFPLSDLRYFPTGSLIIAVSWSLYALIRKQIALENVAALTTETAIAFPLSLGLLIAYHVTGVSPAFGTTPLYNTLLVLTGLMTVSPLFFYGYALARLTMAQMGVLQYIGPGITLLLGIFLYHEPLSWQRKGLIFTLAAALLLYAWDGWRNAAKRST